MEDTSLQTASAVAPETNVFVALRRHWLIAALAAATVFGGMAVKTLSEPGLYRSEALIVLSNRASVPIVQDSMTPEQAEKSLPTEIEILQSSTLLNRALAKLEPSYRTIPVWQIQSQLSLTQPKDTNVLALAYEDVDATRAKAILDAIVTTYIAYSEESRRSPVANAVKFIDQRLPDLKKSLDKSSNALTNFRTKHNLDNPETSVNLAYSTQQALQQSINIAEIELNQVRQTYQALKIELAKLGQNPDTALPDAVVSQNTTYQNLLEQLAALEIQYKLELTRFTPNHPFMLDLKERRDVLKKIVDAQSPETLDKRRGNLSANTRLVPIQQDLATQLLTTNLTLKEKEKQLADLQKQAVESNIKLQQLLKLQQEYQELNRQYQLNAKTLDGFLSKLQELRIQEAQDTFTWKIIEAPNLPSVPIARSRIRGLVLGLITGLIAGIAIAIFLEKIDTRFKEVLDIEEATNLPILGIVPQSQAATSISLHSSDSFTESIRFLALALSFQDSLLTGKIIAITSAIAGEGKTTVVYNLGLALAELNKRVLIVDANLAHPHLHEVFGLTNQQGLTTAIATDKHWQELTCSAHFQMSENLEESRAIREILPQNLTLESKNNGFPAPVFARVTTAPLMSRHHENTNGEMSNGSSLLQPTPRYPDILTTGPVSVASFPWLVSVKMLQLIEQWRKVYDYILLDTSNITEIADTQSLMPKVDRVVMVVSLKNVEKKQVSQALELLKFNQSKIGGIVVNSTGRRKGKGEAYTPFS